MLPQQHPQTTSGSVRRRIVEQQLVTHIRHETAGSIGELLRDAVGTYLAIAGISPGHSWWC